MLIFKIMENFYKKIYEIQQSGQAAALCTIVETSGSTPRKAGAKMIVFINKTVYGTIGGGNLEQAVIKQAVKCINENTCGVFEYNFNTSNSNNCGGNSKVFIEPLNTFKKLYIFGAGNIGKFLAETATKTGFSVTLIDDRENIFNGFKAIDVNTVNTGFANFIDKTTFDKNSFICLSTYKHDIDETLAGKCLKFDVAYIGMLGGKNKIETIKKNLLDNNIVTKQEFDKLHTPIGINITCETPQEIAIAILAQLIDIKNSNSKK
jgi:xanthine dehydrogenase accessory factor